MKKYNYNICFDLSCDLVMMNYIENKVFFRFAKLYFNSYAFHTIVIRVNFSK